MKTLIEDCAPVPRHLEDPELIAYLDGELLRGEQEEARAHLESCWNCRSRVLAMQNSIEKFLQVRKEIAPADMPPSSTAVAQFRQRLSRHNVAPISLRMQLRRKLPGLRPKAFNLKFEIFETRAWRRLLPDFSLLLKYKKTALATALGAVTLFVAVVDPFNWTMASADELLARADAYEFLHELSTGKVVRSRVRLERVGDNAKYIGQLETVADNLSPAVYVSAQDTTGTSGEKSLVDREQLSTAIPFTSDFGPQLTAYLSAQAWFPDVSVAGYRKLIRGRGLSGSDHVVATYRGTSYELHHGFAQGHASSISETVLVLDAKTYAAERVSIFTAGSSDGVVEYRLTRTAFESLERTPEVAQLFDDGRPAGVTNPLAATSAASPEIPAGSLPASPRLPVSVSPVTASAELEVEVLRLLNQIGADLGEQVSVTRTEVGVLRVSGIVETDQRKGEILRALETVSSNPALRIDIQTVAEAMAQRKQTTDASRSATVEGIEIAADTFPAYADLRASMSDEEARVFAARMVARSHSAMRHAWALKRLMSQFAPEALASLEPDARAKWTALIRTHARAFERETANLRQQLEPIFSPGNISGGSQGLSEVANDAEMARVVARLVELASANYEVVRSAFTVSSSSSATSAIRTRQFWQSLVGAEAVAASIQRAR